MPAEVTVMDETIPLQSIVGEGRGGGLENEYAHCNLTGHNDKL